MQADPKITASNDFPRLNINTEELRTEVEMLLAAAGEDAENMGAVNWAISACMISSIGCQC